MGAHLALAAVVQHMGIRACPNCLTQEEQLCPYPWFHLATAVCHRCEGVQDYRAEHHEECPAVAIARLGATCKAVATARDPAEAQEHIHTQQALREQFRKDLSERPFGKTPALN